MVIWKEGSVLFNDALNTFHLQLYGIRHMVKDHSDSERGKLLPPLHGLLFLISSKGSFICTSTGWNNGYMVSLICTLSPYPIQFQVRNYVNLYLFIFHCVPCKSHVRWVLHLLYKYVTFFRRVSSGPYWSFSIFWCNWWQR